MLQRSTGETTRTGSWLPGTRMYGRNALVDQELVDVARGPRLRSSSRGAGSGQVTGSPGAWSDPLDCPLSE
jgi:hypothetical protein